MANLNWKSKWRSGEDGHIDHCEAKAFGKAKGKSLSEGAEIESLSEGQERMAMATQIIVKRKLSGKQKSKWGSRKRKSKWGLGTRKSKSADIIASRAKGSLRFIQSWLSCTHECHALETVMHSRLSCTKSKWGSGEVGNGPTDYCDAKAFAKEKV